MRIKQYIVTYNNNDVLQKCLHSMKGVTHEITIIDNFGNCEIPELDYEVKVIHNALRPTFSTGHLAKDWNAGLVLGFEDLQNPKADIVILNQNDVVFKPNYIERLMKLHERFDFIQMGSGDEMMSFTPNAVKRIGLFDERFCNIGFQEADYFLRAWIHHPTKSTITDINHDRYLNKLSADEFVIENVECGHIRGEESAISSAVYHKHSSSVFFTKWNKLPLDRNWSRVRADFPIHRVKPISSYISYPYFEKHIETLTEQNFIYTL